MTRDVGDDWGRALWIGVILALGLGLMPLRARAEFKPALACPSPKTPIDERAYVTIGGIAQWVTIKGEACDNPIILFIHGGPGNPLSPYSDAMFAGWSKSFTIVQWDQRGAGKTFARSPTPDQRLSLDVMTQDGLEVAAYLTRRLGQPRVILWGSSWGSALGVMMAKARPDLFYAYVGTSQMVNGRENLMETYGRTLTLARQSRDAQSLEILQAVGRPPWADPRSFGAVRRITKAYEARVADPAPKAWGTPAKDYSGADYDAAYEAGEDYSYINFVGLKGDGLLWRIDLARLGPKFSIPVYLVQGMEDLVTVPSLTQRYYDAIEAPDKALVLLPNVGHDPNEAMIAAQYKILMDRVRPKIVP